ncbi:MAG: hypothetical protein H6678_10625 [Candidatus Delongbacteria bacterium]|nr:hypothetical protein [Candidatus Delongbacteria bacterium]
MASALVLLALTKGLRAAGPACEIVDFQFRAPDGATQISVAGSFNQWDPAAAPMELGDDGLWHTSLCLAPGWYTYKFVAGKVWLTDWGNPQRISDGGLGFDAILKVGEPPVPVRRLNPEPMPGDLLPEPILDGDPDWIELYHAAWEMAWNRLTAGTPENGFAPSYMDEGFNEWIYQWDSCFISAWAVYGRRLFPAMAALDNFYGKQRKDGAIFRVYRESDGTPANEPLASEPLSLEPMLNPPLFAWIEWRWLWITGDRSRLERVVPRLAALDTYISRVCADSRGEGLFYTSALGSGMDNLPRPGVGRAGWVDFSAQQILAARRLASLAREAGDGRVTNWFNQQAARRTVALNRYCWDDELGVYKDRTEDGELSPVLHLGAYWALLAQAVPGDRRKAMVDHLRNPDEFLRPCPLPALAASDSLYDPAGRYWRGGVWAPTSYMVIRGLGDVGEHHLADSLASATIDWMSRVYHQFTPATERLPHDERFGDAYHTIWECYSAERPEPATRWDGRYLSRQDFVGWSGLGPIALLIENVLGLECSGLENRITWRVGRSDRHGIRRLPLGEQDVDLLCEPRGEDRWFTVAATDPFDLRLEWAGRDTLLTVPAGGTGFLLRK